MLFKKVQTQAEFVGLSDSGYQAIYELLLVKSPQSIRLMDGYSMVHIQIVLDEAKRLENEINSRMSGGYVIDEATYDNDGIELTPVVYFSVTDEASLQDSLSSEILDINDVVFDVRIWSDGNPDVEPSWTVYKNSFVVDNG
jgi:hypothetical protein